MPGVLRALGVARAVLGLVGRYRVARVVSVVVALGWCLVAVAGRSDAAGPGALDHAGPAHDLGADHAVVLGPARLGALVAVGAGYIGPLIAYAVLVWLCCAVAGLVWRNDPALHRGAGDALDSPADPDRGPDRSDDGLGDGHELGPVNG